jgi:hypothetical protein
MKKINWRELGKKFGAKFDGCTSAPDGNWLTCCDEHDARYQFYGQSKLKADWLLAKCMFCRPGVKGKLLAPVYWLAVSTVGWLHYRKKQNEALAKAQRELEVA